MWWFIAPSFAQDSTARPPELTDARLDDIHAWEAGSRVLLDGPDACVAFEGSVVMRVVLFTPGGWLGPGDRHDMVATGTFTGTLDHGVWTSLTTTWNPTEGDQLSFDRIHPIVGRLPAPVAAPPPPASDGTTQVGSTVKTEDGGSISISGSNAGANVAVTGGTEAALGLLDEILKNIDPSVTTSYASWNGERRAVVLSQQVPLKREQGDLEMEVYFPEGGPATSLDAVFPPRIKTGDGLIKVSVHDAQLHLRGKSTSLGVLPGEEGASMVIGLLGYTVGADQQLHYTRARPCSTSP